LDKKLINIALYQPDIPQNTAAIIRTCSCFDICLEIIKPTGYIFNEKKLDRIYMDYFKNCQIKYYNNFDQFIEIKKNNRVILFTTKTTNQFYKFKYEKSDTLLFGSESKGVGQTVHNIVQNKVNIPIKKDTRSLNLASSVAIAASEALRQINLY
jgi:tRNA (cytidine/uridine-2'-O-)-methyltransferase